MTPTQRAEEAALEIHRTTYCCGKEADDNCVYVKDIAAALQRFAEEQIVEEHKNIAIKQALIQGESTMLNGKIVTNEELYKQPVDYIREARNAALDEAQKEMEKAGLMVAANLIFLLKSKAK